MGAEFFKTGGAGGGGGGGMNPMQSRALSATLPTQFQPGGGSLSPPPGPMSTAPPSFMQRIGNGISAYAKWANNPSDQRKQVAMAMLGMGQGLLSQERGESWGPAAARGIGQGIQGYREQDRVNRAQHFRDSVSQNEGISDQEREMLMALEPGQAADYMIRGRGQDVVSAASQGNLSLGYAGIDSTESMYDATMRQRGGEFDTTHALELLKFRAAEGHAISRDRRESDMFTEAIRTGDRAYSLQELDLGRSHALAKTRQESDILFNERDFGQRVSEYNQGYAANRADTRWTQNRTTARDDRSDLEFGLLRGDNRSDRASDEKYRGTVFDRGVIENDRDYGRRVLETDRTHNTGNDRFRIEDLYRNRMADQGDLDSDRLDKRARTAERHRRGEAKTGLGLRRQQMKDENSRYYAGIEQETNALLAKLNLSREEREDIRNREDGRDIALQLYRDKQIKLGYDRLSDSDFRNAQKRIDRMSEREAKTQADLATMALGGNLRAMKDLMEMDAFAEMGPSDWQEWARSSKEPNSKNTPRPVIAFLDAYQKNNNPMGNMFREQGSIPTGKGIYGPEEDTDAY